MPDDVIAFNWQAAGNQTTLGASEETAATLSKSTTQAVAFATREIAGAITSNYGKQCDNSDTALGPNVVIQPVAYDMRGREGGAQFEGPHDTANIRAASGGSSRSYVAATAVRRLTPRECERLQGFPDDYTLIPSRTNKAGEHPDGPRYKALGNSMAVPVMRWIGQRIAIVDAIP